MKAFKTMLKTELKLSFKRDGYVYFAICRPVVVTILLVSSYGDKLAFDGASYTF